MGRVRTTVLVLTISAVAVPMIGSMITPEQVSNWPIGLPTRTLWANYDAATDGSVDSGGVSADGRYLLYPAAVSRQLEIRDLRTGAIRPVPTASACTISEPVISPDGKQVVYICSNAGNNSVRLTDVDAISDRELYRHQDSPDISLHQVIADRSGVLASLNSPSRTELVIVSTRDGSVTSLLADRTLAGSAALSGDNKQVAFARRAPDGARSLRLFVRTIDGQHETQITTPRDRCDITGWLQSRSVIFVCPSADTRRTELWRYSLDGTSTLLDTPAERIFPVGLTTDGGFVHAAFPREIDLFDVDFDPVRATVSSQPRRISQDYPGRSFYPRLLANGTRLSYVVFPEGYPIITRSFPEGQDRVVPIDFARTIGMTWTPDDRLVVLGIPRGEGTLGYYRVDPDTGKSTLFFSSNVPGGRVAGLSAIGIPQFGQDGKVLFYRDDQRHAVLARELGAESERVLYQLPGPQYPLLRSVYPSPDGRWVGFITNGPSSDSLMVVASSGGPARELATATRPESMYVTGIAWLPDSRRIVFAQGRGNQRALLSVRVDGGTPEPTGVAMEGIRHPFVHPNGMKLLFAAGSDGTINIRTLGPLN